MVYKYPVKYKGVFYPVSSEVPTEEETGTETSTGEETGTGKAKVSEANKKTKQSEK